MRILTVVHGIPPASPGGTERAAWELATRLARTHSVAVFCPGPPLPRGGQQLRRFRREGVQVIEAGRRGGPPGHFRDSYRDAGVEAAFATVLASEPWDVMHVHHLTHLSMALPMMAAARGIRVVLTLHDAWMSCGRGQLVDLDLKVCSGPSPAGCGHCLGDQLHLGSGRARVGRPLRSILTRWGLGPVWNQLQEGALKVGEISHAHRDLLQERQDLARSVVDSAAMITAPSHDLLWRLGEAGLLRGLPSSRLAHIPNLPPPLRPPGIRPPPGPLRVVFVGSLIPTKGVGVLMEALRLLPRGQVEVEVIGPSVPFHRMPGWTNLLIQSAPPGVIFRGELPHSQVLESIDHAHVLVLPALWPENAPLTVREALVGGVPVITSRVGGIPEVVEDGINGLMVPPGDPGALARALQEMAHPLRWAKLAQGAWQTGQKLQVDPTPRWEEVLSGEGMTGW